MGRDRVDVSEYAGDHATLVAQLREANAHRADMSGGFVWFFHSTPGDDSRVLNAGVRGDVGVLEWIDNETEEVFLPGGSNSEDADYFTWFGDHTPMAPGTEVPFDLVLRAVGEFAQTRQRPTCVEWIDESSASGLKR